MSSRWLSGRLGPRRRRPLSLRARVVGAFLLLLVLGLAIANIVTWEVLRSFEGARVDDQLRAAQRPAAAAVREASVFGVPIQGGGSTNFYAPGTFGVVLSPTGNALTPVAYLGKPANTSVSTATPMPTKAQLQRIGSAGTGSTIYLTLHGKEGSYRAIAMDLNGRGDVFLVGVPLSSMLATLRRLALVEVLVSSGVALIGLGGAIWLVRLGLRPLDDIVSTADHIAEGDLSRRVERADSTTEVGRLGLALNEMLSRIERSFNAQQASEARLRRFVADASHELRTPLTSIRGYAELFRRGAAERPEDLALAMRRIESEASRMGILVDDLLLLARLDQGRALERVPVDLSMLAADAVSDTRAVAPERPVTLETNGPVMVDGDDARLRQVAANLLANARVHTPEGTPVHVRVSENDGHAILEVADEGEGIGSDEAEKVFERFYRADPARRRNGTSGTGLGLSIVQAVVQAHGGRASVRSAPGGGASFVVSLPLSGSGHPAAPLEESSTGSSAAGR